MIQEEFAMEAEKIALERLEEFKALSLDEVLKIPEAEAWDIVVAGKEVQMTVFRQTGIPDIPQAVLVTAQIIRAGMGGIVTYHHEEGLVFLPQGGNRAATEEELLATAG